MSKLSILFILVLLVFSCSKPTDQENLDQAKNLIKEKKIDEAVKILEKILNEHPESNVAPKALVELGTLYQGQLDPNVARNESFNRSQKYFREVYDKYPKSEEAPNSLFMSAFILANDLRKYDEATMTYKLFIEKYPDHPLVQSAKDELENMGLSPEEILKKKSVAEK